MKSSYAILAAFLVLGCTTLRDSSQPAATTRSEFKNLLILPRDIPRDDLIATMRGFTRSLGVKCNYCHVVTTTTPKEELDFPSDAKEEKRVARVMMQMTRQINHEWMDRVEKAEGEHPPAPAAVEGEEMPRVSCWTCHRGHDEPEMPPPPPADGDQRPSR
jgi:hypothetical protein